MSVAATDLTVIHDRVFAMIRRKRAIGLAIPALILAYLAYVFFAFDVPGLAERARLDNARILLQDFWSHKTHVTLDSRNGALTTAIEGSRKMTYAKGQEPDWVAPVAGGADITMPHGNHVLMLPDHVTLTQGKGHVLTIARTPDGIVTSGDAGDARVSASDTRVDVFLPGGRVTVTASRSEVQRRFAGWELFFFTLDSAYHGKGPLALAGLIADDPTHIGGMWHDFWTNKVWHHRDVAWAMGETVLMAFLGTFGAGLVALPLAFLAAQNFAPGRVVRQIGRRLFDFLRGVDGLIWTVILSRAFGPGPLTGSLAILLTDTGSFGKLFSEAIENIDKRQIEGLRATGAGPVQRIRWGVLPQIAPVIMSQLLYYLESNTRSATVIGAIVGGGIGLLLTQAIVTQQDWEHVTYYIILIVLVVMAMDWLSGIVRRRLIKG